MDVTVPSKLRKCRLIRANPEIQKKHEGFDLIGNFFSVTSYSKV